VPFLRPARSIADHSRETPFHEIVRCPGDYRCRTLPRCWRVGRNEIADVCRGRCWSGACLLPVRWHCRGRHRCRCGLPCVAHRCPRQPWRRWRRCQGPALPSSLGAFAGGGGVSCVASRTSQRLSAGRCWACARWLPLRGLAVEQPPGCCFLRSRSILQHIETEASRPATPVTSSRSLFQKEKHPETPCRPVAAVAAPQRSHRHSGERHSGRRCSCFQRTPTPPLPPAPVCGRLRAKSVFRVPNHTSTERN
jgi:hypothetical protein